MRSFFISCALLVACAQVDVASSSAPVVGGYFDTSNGPTVGIFRCSGACAFTPYLNASEICSGTLIAPNLILTARHCVAPQENEIAGGIVCGTTTFDAPFPANNFIATPADNVLAGGPWYIAEEVDVAGHDGDFVCGNDLAVLVLRESYVGATPMTPRLLTPPTRNELYSAIGYGDDLDGGIGYRHRRDDLKVDCVGVLCQSPTLVSAEWIGQTGLCGGDSGGPAVDVSGLLFGVTSRANAAACTTPIYSRVDSHAAWLQAEAVKAASAGNYALPSWAYASIASSSPDASVAMDASAASDASPAQNAVDASVEEIPANARGGCAIAPDTRTSCTANAAAILAGLVLLLRSARRRSKSIA